jgi:hypothetical protein
MSGYVYDPTSPFHKLWQDELGQIRVICEPSQGYVMVRRPGAMPFVVSVHYLLSGKQYQPVVKTKAKSARAALPGGGGK